MMLDYLNLGDRFSLLQTRSANCFLDPTDFLISIFHLSLNFFLQIWSPFAELHSSAHKYDLRQKHPQAANRCKMLLNSWVIAEEQQDTGDNTWSSLYKASWTELICKLGKFYVPVGLIICHVFKVMLESWKLSFKKYVF